MILRGVALEKCRVRAKLLTGAMKLTLPAQDHFRSRIEGPNGAAQLDVESTILLEIANIFAIAFETDDGKSALGVGNKRTANVEETSAVSEFNYVVNVSHQAYIFIQVLACQFRGDTAFF